MKPARILSRVDLPQPEGPSRQTNSPVPDVEIDRVERLDALAGRIDEALAHRAEMHLGRRSGRFTGKLCASDLLQA